MLYLTPHLLPMRGSKLTPAQVRQFAQQTLPGVLAAREKYRRLAEQQYRELVIAPIIRPPLRTYTTESWAASLATVLTPDVPDDDREPVGEPEIEEVLIKADLQGREAERSQLIAYAMHDSDIIGWARVDREPPTCPFCTMLISRGPVYTSAKTAGDRNRFHGGCTCEVVLVTESTRDSYSGVEISKAAESLWREASKGRSGKAVPAEFRRLVEEKNGVTRRTKMGRTKETAEQTAQDGAVEALRVARVQLDTLSKIRPQNESQRQYQQRATLAVTKRIAALQKLTPGG